MFDEQEEIEETCYNRNRGTSTISEPWQWDDNSDLQWDDNSTVDTD